MGSFFSKKSKKSKEEQTPAKKNDKVSGTSALAKSRVNEADKSILEIKARMKKIVMYQKNLELDVKNQNAKIQEHLKEKNKNRAMMALKHRKFMEKQLEKSIAAQGLLEQTIRNIESAQVDVDIFEAMKQGDKVIQDLQKQVTIEQIEELYDRHQEQQARKDMEAEMFGRVLKEDDLQDELDQLDAMILEEAIPSAASNPVEAVHRPQQVVNQQSAAKESQSSNGRQLLAA